MKNEFTNIAVTMVMGMAFGFGLCIVGQKMINNLQRTTCKDRPDHTLVLITGFIGDAYYCIHNRNL